MSFPRAVLCAVLLLVAQCVGAQEHVKCITGHEDLRNPKSPEPLFPLPDDFLDSMPSPSGRFMVYYNESVTDGTSPIDVVTRAAAECDSAYNFEITQLGYTAPELTDGAHYRFYLAPL